MRIYMDNCCFNRPFDNQTQKKIELETGAKLFIQEKIIKGYFDLVWSYILSYENSMNPFRERQKAIEAWREIAAIDCDENSDIIAIAEKIERLGVKAKDALHLACAIYAECEYFITTDTKLLKKSFEGIKIVDPIQLVKIVEDDEL